MTSYKLSGSGDNFVRRLARAKTMNSPYSGPYKKRKCTAPGRTWCSEDDYGGGTGYCFYCGKQMEVQDQDVIERNERVYEQKLSAMETKRREKVKKAKREWKAQLDAESAEKAAAKNEESADKGFFTRLGWGKSKKPTKSKKGKRKRSKGKRSKRKRSKGKRSKNQN